MLAAFLATLALVAAACGGNGDDDEGAAANGDTQNGAMAEATVDVELTEFMVTPSTESSSAGSIQFDVENVGGIPHEFLVIETDLDPEDLPVSGSTVDEEAEDLTVVGEIEQFGPGTTESVTVDLSPGSHVLICNVPGHYESGMTVGFTVE